MVVKHFSVVPLWSEWIRMLSNLSGIESFHAYEDVLERLTQLENNFTLLLSRSEIQPYASLEEALRASTFRTPELINEDEIVNGIEKIAGKLPRDQQRDSPHLLSIAVIQPDYSKRVTEQRKLFFDPQLIRDGSDCNRTGVRSLVDVPPGVHYPTVGNLSGLTPVMAAMIDCVMRPFRKLNISTTEFAALQAIMFFDPDTEGLDAASQRNVSAEQKKMICAFYSHICQFHEANEAEKRFSAILLRIPMIRKVAAKKNESLQIIDLFNLFTLNTLVKETTLGFKGGNSATQNSGTQ
uniref:NR LBD domain-containing protein n=1 Tax=Globodera pallida TaxID=36090 RepID=A0A183C457_GLOPA